MINIKRGYEDLQELSKIVKGYKDLQEIYDNSTSIDCVNYDKESNYLDMNYKSICATAHMGNDGVPYVGMKDVEVWDKNECDYEYVDYTNYERDV